MLLPELHLLVLEVRQGEMGDVFQFSAVSFLEILQPLAQRHGLRPEGLDTRWIHWDWDDFETSAQLPWFQVGSHER